MLQRIMRHTVHPTDAFFAYVMEAPECDELKLTISTDMTPVLIKGNDGEDYYHIAGIIITITSCGVEVVNVNDVSFNIAISKATVALNDWYMTRNDLIGTIEDDGLTYYNKKE